MALQKVSKEVQATIETCKDEEGLKYVTTKQVSKQLAKVEAKRDDVQIHEQVLTKNTVLMATQPTTCRCWAGKLCDSWMSSRFI